MATKPFFSSWVHVYNFRCLSGHERKKTHRTVEDISYFQIDSHSHTNMCTHVCTHTYTLLCNELIRKPLPNLGPSLQRSQLFFLFPDTITSKQYPGIRQYLLACKARDNDPIQSEHMNNSRVPTSHNFWLYF